MTITRVYQSGFETGSLAEIATVGTSPTIAASPYTGTYSLRTRELTIYASMGDVLIPSTKQMRAGMHGYGRPAAGSTYKNIQATCSDFNIDICLSSSTTMALEVNGTQRDTWGGYIFDWKHIGFDVKKDAVSGWAKVYIDGVEIMSWSGNTGSGNITNLRMGKVWSANYDVDLYWDNIYVDDTTGEAAAAPAIKQFYYVAPNGAGNYTQWDPSAGANYECVDEKPPSDADYVTTNVTDELDSYAMSSFTLAEGQVIDAVIPITRIKRLGITGQVALGTRYSSTDVVGSDQNPAATYSYLSERQVAKPGGGAWDQTSLDGFEAILKSRGTY